MNRVGVNKKTNFMILKKRIFKFWIILQKNKIQFFPKILLKFFINSIEWKGVENRAIQHRHFETRIKVYQYGIFYYIRNIVRIFFIAVTTVPSYRNILFSFHRSFSFFSFYPKSGFVNIVISLTMLMEHDLIANVWMHCSRFHYRTFKLLHFLKIIFLVIYSSFSRFIYYRYYSN